MNTHLSAETWRQLDPYAGRLSRRDVGRVRLVVTASVLLIAILAAGVHAGLLLPRLETGGSAAYFRDPVRPVVGYGFEVVNLGRFTVEVIAVGRAGPGLVPIPPPPEVDGGELGSGTGFGRLGPGESMWLAVGYEVTDCAAVPVEPWPIPIRIVRPWGTYTEWFHPPLQAPDEFSEAPRDVVPAVEWQRNLADAVCTRR